MKPVVKYCFLAVALITIASVSSTYAATPRSEGSKPKRGGTIVIGTPFEPRQLNLAITTSWADLLVACKVFNGLLRFPDKGYPEPQPDLAEKWSISPDGKRITFNLVHNARWHDGVPFTSADVKFTYEKVTRELSPIRSVFQSITKIVTPDPYTVVIERSRPFSLLYFNGSGGAILPKHLYENTDIATNPHNLRPVGTGPFKLKEWVKGSHIELVRSGDYFKPGKPYLDRVIFKFIGDVPSGIAALEKGEIDYLPRWIPVGEVERLKKHGGIDVSPVGGIGFSQMRWMTFIDSCINNATLSARKGAGPIA
jgi:peptide/nickel transport system substrate-binding protein